MNVLIIEPHGDDALFSMFDICKLYKSGRISKLDILTLAGRGSYDFVSAGYASESRFLDLEDIDFKDRPTKHTEVNRLFKNNIDLESHFSGLILERYENQMIDLTEALKVINFDTYDYVVTVAGVAHVNHILARIAACNNVDRSKLILCSDVPYSHKVYGRKLLNSAIGQGYKLKYGSNGKNFINEKIECLKKYYPSETLFLRWDKDNIAKPCEYWYKSDNKLMELLDHENGGINE